VENPAESRRRPMGPSSEAVGFLAPAAGAKNLCPHPCNWPLRWRRRRQVSGDREPPRRGRGEACLRQRPWRWPGTTRTVGDSVGFGWVWPFGWEEAGAREFRFGRGVRKQ
jgi:hypothetical protein